MDYRKGKILLHYLNQVFNPVRVIDNTYKLGVKFCSGTVNGTKSSFAYVAELINERSYSTKLFYSKLGEFYKLIFSLLLLLSLSSAYFIGLSVASFSTSFSQNYSNIRLESQYIPSSGTGNENLTNNSKDTLRNIVQLILDNLRKSDGFLKAVFSERPVYLQNDTISINGETFQSPKKLIYGSALGISYSLVTLFIIFDTLKILMGQGGDFRKLFYKYFIGFIAVSVSGIILNYSIEMANAVTRDLLVNNSDPNRSKIGQILDDYLVSVQSSYTNVQRWPWDYWWGAEAGWNPINVLKDYINITFEILPLMGLLLILLANAFALLTNWVVMYVLAGIAPLAICFYLIDWNHSYPRNFLNAWFQNLLQLPLFSFVFYTFVTFLNGGLSVGNPFKLALFYAFLFVMLNVNQNFGNIFTGITSQVGNFGGSLFAGLGTTAVSTAGSASLRQLGKNGAVRKIAGGIGTMAINSGSNFTKGITTGSSKGVSGRIGQSVNSFGQGLAGKRTSSYVSNRLGRMVGSIGIGDANITTGIKNTGSALNRTSSFINETLQKTSQTIKSLKTDPSKPANTGPDPVKNIKPN